MVLGNGHRGLSGFRPDYSAISWAAVFWAVINKGGFTMKKATLNLLAAAALSASLWAQAAEGTKVVYHLSDGVQQASRAIGNIRNHLNADPTAKIVVVTHGPGIDFLMDGAENMSGQKFASAIGELSGRGVEFRVCNNTLNRH